MNFEKEVAAKQRAMMNMGMESYGQASLGNALAPTPPTPLVQQQAMLLSAEIDRLHDTLAALQARLEPTVLHQAPQPTNPAKDSPTAYPVGLAESLANLTRGVASARTIAADMLNRLEV